MTRKDYALLAVAAVALWIASCSSNSSNGKAAKAPEKPIFFVSVTGDGEDDPQRTDMALKLAGFALEENREVVLFFNVKGVHLPTKDFPADRKFKDDAPLKSQLEKLIEKFAGGPVGLNSLAVALGEDSNTLEEVYEPFLIQEGFLMRTPRGRVTTPRAYRRFGYRMPEEMAGPDGTGPEGVQSSLFEE